MSFFRLFTIVCSLMILTACSGGGSGIGNLFNTNPSGSTNSPTNSSDPSSTVIPAGMSVSEFETAKLQEALKSDPAYKIDDVEISLLQSEGVTTDADKAQLQAVQ